MIYDKQGPINFGPEPIAMSARRIAWMIIALVGFALAVVMVAVVVNAMMTSPASAEETFAVVSAGQPQTWWQIAIAWATPAAMAFIGAAFIALGKVVKVKADQFLGPFVGRIVSDQYEKMSNAGAGIIENELKKLAGGAQSPFQAALVPAGSVAPTPVLTIEHPAVKAAVEYVHDSFPEALAKAGVFGSKAEVAADIIGAFGKLQLGKAKPASG